MVNLNGMVTMVRKFYVPEIGRHGHLVHFPTDYGHSTNQRTVNLSPGDYKFVVMHIEFNGGSGLNSVLVRQVLLSHQGEAYGFRTGRLMVYFRNFPILRISRHSLVSWLLFKVWPRTKHTISELMRVILRVRTGRMQPPVL